MSARIRHLLPAVIGAVLFVAAIAVLRHDLHEITWRTLSADLRTLRPSLLVAAVGLTALNYAVLTGYDLIACAYIHKPLPRWRVAGASFVAYAIANNLGFAMLSGASVRYRFYTRWGVAADELSRIVFSYSTTFWLGLLALGGLSLALTPVASTTGLLAFGFAAPIGWALAGASTAYVVVAGVRREPLRLWRFELPLPSLRLAFAQLVVSSADWALAGAVFYVLLPSSGVPFFTVLGAFLVAQLLGLASHVPGGVGVFESLIVVFLSPYVGSAQLVPSLVAYRAVYYLAPLLVAVVALVADEAQLRRAQVARASALLGRAAERLAPKLLATLTFIAGVVLLFSGATPAADGRLALLNRLLPLGVIEGSHFIASVIGAVLLLVSQGLARRLDVAYLLATVAIGGGIATSLLKAVDYEEALLLSALLLMLQRARPAFTRKAAIFATRFSAAWSASVVAAVLASVWLGLFAFKHVDYSNDLWWQFALDGDASRFLRASVGASAAVLLFAIARLVSVAPHEAEPPTSADYADAARILATQPSTLPNLLFLGDKALIFDDRRSAFLMYAVQGRTWVALGDPVGPAERAPELIRLFLERCHDFGGTPVFYQVGRDSLHVYADFGLTFVKLGEEARVDLAAFSLDGARGSKHRQAIRRLEKDGGSFRVITPAQVIAAMPELREVSDDWLHAKATGEKGFSLGYFDADYLARFPAAVIEVDGRICAFANLWAGATRDELSIDLMRYRHDAPRSVMEALIVHVLAWGKAEGYRRFALGMAPMSGFEESPVSPLWARCGRFLYQHGEAIYRFQGLRAYKEKFHPEWESRYLAYPGGLVLARLLADISALIAGGYRKIFVK